MRGSDPGRTVESSWPPDPFTEPGPRFALAGTKTSLREDGTAEGPSEIGTRPWGLRRARPAGPGRPVPVRPDTAPNTGLSGQGDGELLNEPRHGAEFGAELVEASSAEEGIRHGPRIDLAVRHRCSFWR